MSPRRAGAAPQVEAQKPPPSVRRLLLAVSLGNALEW